MKRTRAPYKTRYTCHPIVAQIVDREHVGESNRHVIRQVVRKLRRGWTSFREMTRADRRELMRQAINRHWANRDLYAFVMKGR